MQNHSLNAVVQERENISFALLFISIVLGLSWLRFIPILSDHYIGTLLADSVFLIVAASFSPLIGALTLILYRSGLPGVRSFLRNGLTLGGSLRWYALALLLFPLLYIGAAAIYGLISGAIPETEQIEWILLLDIFTVGLIFYLNEEYGWRGYLQRTLQPNLSVSNASVIVGVIWALWHAPLFLNSEAIQSDLNFGWYAALLIGVSVIFGWVYIETNESIVVVTLMHATFNASIGLLSFYFISMSIDTTPYLIISTVVTWLVVSMIIGSTKRSAQK